jgi:DNA-binding protein HU-beta
MNGFRISQAIAAALASLALTAAAQGTSTADPKKMDPPKADAKKADAKKAPAKAAPKKAAPKKVDGKVQTTAKGGTVQKFEASKAPALKDAKGNTVPSSPDAYDLSSATKKK